MAWESNGHLTGENTLKLFGRQTQLELALDGDADATGLLTDNNGYCIAVLRYTHSGTVAQSEFLWNVGLVADRENTSGGTDALVRYNHGSVVEWGVLEEYVFDEPLVDLCVDDITGVDNIVERG